MKKFLIPEDIAQAIANYLSARPWREVDHLVQALVGLQEAPPPEAPAKPSATD
jgi:hypothetical protein